MTPPDPAASVKPIAPAPATEGLRRLMSRLGRRAREAMLLPRLARGRLSGRRRALFFPSTPPRDSSLLRAYLIADALEARGWATLVAPSQLELGQRRRLLALFRPDVSILRTARHALNDIVHFDGFPVVLDMDDADFADPRLVERLERTCQGALGVIAGSRHVAAWCRRINPATEVVWTGTPITAGPRTPHADRGPVVAWAQADPLGYPAELDFVCDVLLRALARGARPTLRLYGWRGAPDDPRLERLRAAGAPVELTPRLDYAGFLRSLQSVAVGLSPICAQSPFSRGKSFGKILGYLDAMTPVIASDEADHALFFDAGSGVISNDPDVWAEALARLLPDPAARAAMAARAFAAFETRLSIPAAAARVDAFLGRLVASAPV